MNAKIAQVLQVSVGVCLTSDGWSNVNAESIINYCGVTADGTFFLECNYTGAQSHSAAFIAADIKRVISNSTSVNFVGCCTDNTSANKLAWEILRESYPDKYFYGCICHVLHLLVGDCIKSMDWLNALESNCREVVKTIKNSP